MREKSVIILEHLLDGGKVNIGEYIYMFTEDYRLVVALQNLTTSEIIYGNTFIELQGFMELCDTITEEELVNVIANKTLRRNNE